MDIAKVLIIFGIGLVIVGLLVSAGFRGLPGDIVIQKKNTVIFFPIVSSIVLSLILTLILFLARR
jgi:hypothetical protein